MPCIRNNTKGELCCFTTVERISCNCQKPPQKCPRRAQRRLNIISSPHFEFYVLANQSPEFSLTKWLRLWREKNQKLYLLHLSQALFFCIAAVTNPCLCLELIHTGKHHSFRVVWCSPSTTTTLEKVRSPKSVHFQGFSACAVFAFGTIGAEVENCCWFGCSTSQTTSWHKVLWLPLSEMQFEQKF